MLGVGDLTDELRRRIGGRGGGEQRESNDGDGVDSHA
jgi:hypothetical protein